MDGSVDGGENLIRVRKIESGTVVDHLPAGSALAALDLLGVNGSFPGTVSVLMNAPSSQYGLKDIIKIEGRDFSKGELERLALLAPYATVNIIRDWRVIEKFRVQMPARITASLDCPNPRCVTRIEGESKLSVEGKAPLRLRCYYCERLFGENEVFPPNSQARPSLYKWTK